MKKDEEKIILKLIEREIKKDEKLEIEIEESIKEYEKSTQKKEKVEKLISQLNSSEKLQKQETINKIITIIIILLKKNMSEEIEIYYKNKESLKIIINKYLKIHTINYQKHISNIQVSFMEEFKRGIRSVKYYFIFQIIAILLFYSINKKMFKLDENFLNLVCLLGFYFFNNFITKFVKIIFNN
jgi:hypothetical protein